MPADVTLGAVYLHSLGRPDAIKLVDPKADTPYLHSVGRVEAGVDAGAAVALLGWAKGWQALPDTAGSWRQGHGHSHGRPMAGHACALRGRGAEGRGGGRLSARLGGWLRVRVWSDKNNLS